MLGRTPVPSAPERTRSMSSRTQTRSPTQGRRFYAVAPLPAKTPASAFPPHTRSAHPPSGRLQPLPGTSAQAQAQAGMGADAASTSRPVPDAINSTYPPRSSAPARPAPAASDPRGQPSEPAVKRDPYSAARPAPEDRAFNGSRFAPLSSLPRDRRLPPSTLPDTRSPEPEEEFFGFPAPRDDHGGGSFFGERAGGALGGRSGSLNNLANLAAGSGSGSATSLHDRVTASASPSNVADLARRFSGHGSPPMHHASPLSPLTARVVRDVPVTGFSDASPPSHWDSGAARSRSQSFGSSLAHDGGSRLPATGLANPISEPSARPPTRTQRSIPVGSPHAEPSPVVLTRTQPTAAPQPDGSANGVEQAARGRSSSFTAAADKFANITLNAGYSGASGDGSMNIYGAPRRDSGSLLRKDGRPEYAGAGSATGLNGGSEAHWHGGQAAPRNIPVHGLSDRSSYTDGDLDGGPVRASNGGAFARSSIGSNGIDNSLSPNGGLSPPSAVSPPPRNSAPLALPRKFPGLSNLGNTCFMNAVLQCLSSTPGIAEYFLNHDAHKSQRATKLVDAFGDTIKDLWTKSIGCVVPLTLKSEIGRRAPQFVGYSQQDAQEFLRFLLDGLHEDTNRARLKPSQVPPIPDGLDVEEIARRAQDNYRLYASSFVSDIFVGHTRSTLCCLACGFKSVTVEPFWDLSLPIPTRKDMYGSTQVSELKECLEAFSAVETLVGDEQPFCEKCKLRQQCTKQLKIERLPNVLVLHLKRFSYTRSKINTEVIFPWDGLDMAPFCVRRDTAPAVYDLFAVANHMGGLGGGHYTAHCRRADGQWHSFNDSVVVDCDASSVKGPQVYVLFYVRRKHASLM